MAKITIIGAGSTGFAKQFVADILTRPALAEGTLDQIHEMVEENFKADQHLLRA